VLGWIAERYSSLVREIVHRGHEVACHGYKHALITSQTQDEFRLDIRRGKTILEDLAGTEVIGYRAPTYSITPETLWALGCLQEEGFLYDSSIFPINHDYYGFHQAPRYPFLLERPQQGQLMRQMKQPRYIPLDGGRPEHQDSSRAGDFLGVMLEKGKTPQDDLLIEWPLSTIKLLGRNVPCAGGGYFRLFPYRVTRLFMQSLNNSGNPVIFYIHPWEFNPSLPRVNNISFLRRFRTYLNLSKTEDRFKRLLADFRFAPVRDILRIGDQGTGSNT
jgi:polysaccharide deacetylase family protein (PEP-CTERM system associated)